MAKMGLYKTNSKRLVDNYHHIIVINIFILSLMTSSASSSSSSMDFSTAILIRVDQSGKGDFNKIQEAIESIPPNLNNSQLYFIWVKPGIYRYDHMHIHLSVYLVTYCILFSQTLHTLKMVGIKI